MNELQIQKRPILTKGQKLLYTIFSEKLKTNEIISFTEIKKIYINNVCRDTRDGIPYYWNCWYHNDKGEIVGRYEKLSDDCLNSRILLWLTNNIGALVLKGYLKIIPTINIQELNTYGIQKSIKNSL